MANDWFDNFTRFVKGTKARSDAVNSVFDQMVTGMDKMPTENQMNRGTLNYAVDTGAINAYAVTLPHVSTAYQDGQEVIFLATHKNTGASTLNVSAINASAIKMDNGDALMAGMIQDNSLVTVRWNGVNSFWELDGVFSITSTVSAFMETVLVAAHAQSAINLLGFTGDLAEYNVLDGVTASTSELNTVNVAAPGTAEASKAVILDSGKDIAGLGNVGLENAAFPATQVTSADPNTLDDYEEGTWTPILSDGTNDATSSSTTGTYTKVGQIIHITGSINLSAKGSISGPLRIEGLPFGSFAKGGGTISDASGLAITAGQNITFNIISGGSDYIILQLWSHAVSTQSLTDANVTASATFQFSFSYKAPS